MTDPTYEEESFHTPESRDRDARFVGHEVKPDTSKAEVIKLREENARLREALNKVAVSASVSYAKPKKMYKKWRKIAVERIDIARAALKGERHD